MINLYQQGPELWMDQTQTSLINMTMKFGRMIESVENMISKTYTARHPLLSHNGH